MSDCSQQQGGEGGEEGRWFYCTRGAFRASVAIIKASDNPLPVARLQWGMSVNCGKKPRGRQLTTKRLCIIHAACKLASCSLLERNCSEFEIHFLSHTAGLLLTGCRFPVALFRTNHGFILFPIYNSTVVLLQCLCFPPVLYTVSDWIIHYAQYAVYHLFTHVFPIHVHSVFFPPLWIYGCVRGSNAIVNYWDLGNSFILLQSPNIFLSRTQ